MRTSRAKRAVAIAVLAVSLTGTGFGAVVFTYLEGFESYADTPALAAAWPDNAGSPVQTLETIVVLEGLKSLRLAYDLSGAPFLNTVQYAFAEDQDWSYADTFTFYYRGSAGNSPDNIFFQLKDEFGDPLGTAELVLGAQVADWTLAEIDISGYGNIGHGTSLANVRFITIGVSPRDGGYGSGTVYFDDMGESVPEPGVPVLAILGATTLLLIRRAGLRAGRSVPAPTWHGHLARGQPPTGQSAGTALSPGRSPP